MLVFFIYYLLKLCLLKDCVYGLQQLTQTIKVACQPKELPIPIYVIIMPEKYIKLILLTVIFFVDLCNCGC